MVALLLALALALAGPADDDLRMASNEEAPEVTRREAFNRLVERGLTDLSVIEAVARNPNADARQRWVAVRVVGKVGGDRGRKILMDIAQDDMPAMRTAAVQALGDIGDPQLAGQIEGALKDPAIIVRAGAAEALGKLGNPESVRALSDALAARDNYYRGQSLWVRRHYVEALGAIGSPRAVPTLLRCLDDADPAVVAGAMLAFEKVSGRSYAEGRSPEEQKEAWRRWAQSQAR
jgi:HEAT repeat protein